MRMFVHGLAVVCFMAWSEERTKGFVQQEERMVLFTKTPLNVAKVARKVFPGHLAFH